MELFAKREYYVGNEALSKGVICSLSYPIENGIINNLWDMECIWSHIFTNELKIDPCEHNILFTEPISNPKSNREKIAFEMFETFNVLGLYIATSGILCTYSIGKFTSLCIDIGDGVTQILPILNGYLSNSYVRLDLGGRDLTEYMIKELLPEIGIRFKYSCEKTIANKIKEIACYVPIDYDKEGKNIKPYDYELPDGNHIILDEQRIKCPELERVNEFKSLFSISNCNNVKILVLEIL